VSIFWKTAKGVMTRGYWSDKAEIAQMIKRHLGGQLTYGIMSATKAVKVFFKDVAAQVMTMQWLI
jgi:hypothetical protein